MTGLRVVFALLLFGASIGCGTRKAQDQAADSPSPVVAVRTEPVQQQSMPVTVLVDGLTDVLGRERVAAAVDGKILSMPAEVGTRVTVGDTVAVLRTRDAEAAIAGARRLMDAAKTPAQRDQAARAMDVARETEQLVAVTAGRGGVVVAKLVSSGQTVTADTELLELVDLSTLHFAAAVPLADLARVSRGQRVAISFPSLPGRQFEGRVTAVSAQSDPSSQSAPVRVQFGELPDSRGEPLPVGMMGTARITVGEHADVLVVPSRALLRDDLAGTFSLYTVGADSLAHRQAVAVGVTVDSMTEVASAALKVGDRVIVEGAYEVSDSTRVTTAAGASR